MLFRPRVTLRKLGLLQRPIPIHITIATLFLGVVVATSGLLIWYNYEKSRDSAFSSAERSLAEVTDNILLRTQVLLSGLVTFTDSGGELADIGQLPTLSTHPAAPFILRMLDELPQVNSAYMGFDNGEFFQVQSLPPDADAKRQVVKAPADAAFAVIRILRRPDGRRVDIRQFLDRNWRVVGSYVEGSVTYDPRVRPWYRQAMASEESVQTDLYAFRDRNTIGLTVARRFESAVPGVFAADLTLDTLAKFLAEQGARIGGTVVMFRADGRLWAHPHAGTFALKPAAAGSDPALVKMPAIPDLRDPVLETMYQAFLDTGRVARDRLVFEVEDRPYLARISKMQGIIGDDEFVAAIAPLDAFTAPFDAIRTNSLILSLVLVVAVLPIVYVMSREVSRPLWALVREADAIRHLDLDHPIDVRSRITEVRRLSRAMAGMKTVIATFEKFAPRALVEQLIRTGASLELGGDKREITIMFSDVANFTDLTERLPPENVMRKLSSYMQRMTAVILAEGGTIDKFIGDGIMVFWNAPERDREHVVRSCRAALMCRDASERLNAEWESFGWEVMKTRIGLHLGETIVGTVGSADRMDYTAVGATVNLASRLEGLNKFYGTRILASAPVFERSRHAFLFRAVDLVAPKGTTIPIRIYELIGARPGGPADGVGITTSEAQLSRAEIWTQAYETYEGRDWELAGEMFKELQEPDDTVARILLERCDCFRRRPPPDDWDGVERFTSK